MHTLDNFGPAFAIGTALNVDFVIDETIFGLRANSVALLADAGHSLSVTDVHDQYIWAISTADVALTAHLVYPTGDDHDELLRSACDTLTNRFGIGHATLQVERGSDAHACHFASGNVI